jgi:hypothetical protein
MAGAAMLILAVIGLVILVVIGTIFTLFARRRDAIDRPSVVVVGRFVAIAYAAITGIATVVTVLVTLLSETVDVTLPARVEAQPYPWIIPDGGPEASIIGEATAQLNVTVEGLGLDARLFLAGSQLTQGASFVLVAIAFAVLCHRLLAGSPFRPVLTTTMSLAAIAVGVGGIVWQVLAIVGNSIAANQALDIWAWGAEAPTPEVADYLFNIDGTGMPEPSLGFTFDFWPLFFALALSAIAFALRHGERLQRDTEGLV